MKKFAAWFTRARRQAIQVALGGLAPLFIMFGFGTDSVWEQGLIIAGATLQFVASLVNLVNLRGVMEIWTVLRGAVYTFGAVVSPSLVLLGFYDDATNATVLTGVSLALGAISNILAVFTAGHQEIQEVTEAKGIEVLQAFHAGVEQGKN